ncbi:MAG: DUF3883 domain-containing protein [Prevotella sp.]|nr:DUF3883 domain-containing protein [Prevotella sp.]
MDRILFANIGWMIHYNGQSSNDTISGGGSYRDDDKHEAYNFMDLNGWCYGYVQPVGNGNIYLSRIDANIDKSKEKIEDVIVIWTARRPDVGGTYIIGWYKHATVYKTWQEINAVVRNNYAFNVKAKAKDCTLLPVDDRCFQIPRAKKGVKGWIGQSNIWYADSNIIEVKRFRKKVIDYIVTESKQKKTRIKHFGVNVEVKKQVEKAAINIVRKAYEKKGFTVDSVEEENKGWDLEALKEKLMLRIEVKGLSGEEISVYLTQNEYDKMRDKNNANYRLCIVTKVLIDPEMYTFIYNGDKWVCEENSERSLCFDEQIAAIAYIE